jgi:hypothetical protein
MVRAVTGLAAAAPGSDTSALVDRETFVRPLALPRRAGGIVLLAGLY